MASEFTSQLIAARREGRHADSLKIILETLKHEDDPSHYFITMFEWSRLIPEYPPAREAMRAERDGKVVRLLAGEHEFGSREQWWGKSRLCVIVEMNDALGEQHATHQAFAQLHALAPEAARNSAFFALPAVVAAGDYALAAQYLEDPLPKLPELNEIARSLPLFPVGRTAPRVVADLTNFITEVRLMAAVLTGTGRQGEADALCASALAGLESPALRELGARELVEPGTITRELVEHQMEEEDIHE